MTCQRFTSPNRPQERPFRQASPAQSFTLEEGLRRRTVAWSGLIWQVRCRGLGNGSRQFRIPPARRDGCRVHSFLSAGPFPSRAVAAPALKITEQALRQLAPVLLEGSSRAIQASGSGPRPQSDSPQHLMEAQCASARRAATVSLLLQAPDQLAVFLGQGLIFRAGSGGN